MRLTALCICGTLLAFSSLSQMTADEGVLLGDQGFGPCAATLRPGGACRPEGHDNTCPYLFSLPPLTVHLPLQLRELEKIMQDLQKLKDSVDELREMCADCTVSQSERECGKQRGKGHERLNEGKRIHDDGRKWVNVRPEENDREFPQECGKDVAKVEKIDGDNDAVERFILDDKARKKWEADRKSVIKENEREGTQAEERGRDGKTKTEGERKKDPSERTKVTTSGANVVDAMSEKFSEINNGEDDELRNKEEVGKDHSKRYQEDKVENGGERTTTTNEQNNEKTEGSDPQMWRDETIKKEKNAEPDGSDKTKISENLGEYTNKEQEQNREGTRKEMEKEIKTGRNTEKPKQTESTGETEKERTIKELDKKSGKMRKKIKIGSVWKDNDGEISSSTSTERADFVSISPTSPSTTRFTSRSDSMDSLKAKIFTSSLPSPSLPSSTLSSITDVRRDREAVYGPTLSTGSGAAGFPEPRSPVDEELATTTTTITTVGGLTQQITSTATRPTSTSTEEVRARVQGHVSSTPTPTTSPHPKLYATSFPRATGNSHWTPKKNVSSNTKTGVKRPPGKRPKPGEKLKPGIKPEAEQKRKNPKNDHKPDQAPLADKTKSNQKQRPSPDKPTNNKSKPGKDSKQAQVSKPDRQTSPDNVDLTVDGNKLTVQKPKHHQKPVTPFQRFTYTTQRPQGVNTTRSAKYPLLNRKQGPDQNAKPDKKLIHLLIDGRPHQKEKPERKTQGEEKREFNERLETNQNPTPVHEPDARRPTKPIQKHPTKSVGRPDESPSHEPEPSSHSTPGQKTKSEQIDKPDQKPKSSLTIPKINLKPNPGGEPESEQSETATPKPNQHLTTSGDKSDQSPSHEPKSSSEPTPGQKTKSEQTNKPSNQKPKSSRNIPEINPKLNPGGEPEAEQSETTTPKPHQQPLTESVNKSDENYTHKPNSNPDSMPEQNIISQTNTFPDQRPESKKKIPGINQKPQPDQEPGSKSETATPKPNQHLTESGDKSDQSPSQEPKSSSDPTPGHKIKSDPTNKYFDQKPEFGLKIPQINPKPNAGGGPQSGLNETATPRPNQHLTESGDESDQSPSHEPKSSSDPTPGQKTKSEQTNTFSHQKPEFSLKIPQITLKPKPGPVPEYTATPNTTEPPQTELVTKSDENYTHELKSDTDPTDGQNNKPDHINLPPQRPESNKEIPQIDQKPKPGQEPESDRSETAIPKPNRESVTESVNKSDKNPEHKLKSNQDSESEQTPKSNRDNTPPNQKPKLNWNVPKINQKPKPDQVFKPNQKHPKHVGGIKNGPNVNPKPKQAPKSNPSPKTPRPGQKPNLKPKPSPGKLPRVVPDKTLIPKPPSRHRPQIRPVRPGPKPVQRPKPAVQPKLNQKTKTQSDPPQISWTASNSIQSSQTDMPPTSGLVKQISEVTHSPGDTEFSASMRKTITLGPKTSNSLETGPDSHRLPEDFTSSPNSRIMSDLRPQTTIQPPSIQMTTRPNKINRGILRSVITSTSPESTHPSLVSKSEPRTQANMLHNVEETRPATPVPSPSSRTSSTLSPDAGSATPITSGPRTPAAELSTPSTRELRVKINQVAAFFNNSLSPNARPADRLPKQQPEGTLGGNKPDKTASRPPTSEPSTVRRDCSEHLLGGETKSGVYLVTPDPRSRSFPVFCDMERDGGGWTLLQRRQDGSVSFNRTWTEYRSGFGELDGGEFWLGNNMIHLLTRDRDMVLRVELEDFDGVKEHAQYEQFRVAGEGLRYRLTVGGYSGTAGDALRFNKMYDHNNRAFTTPDKDHDRYPSGNCGAYYSSGWWFDACMAANLNGRYHFGKYKGVRDGIFWGTWHNISKEYYPTNDRQSFKTVRMMIRPKGFAP